MLAELCGHREAGLDLRARALYRWDVESIEHRWFAAVYGFLNAQNERHWLRDERAALLANVQGRVLEIGGGSGANLAHYPKEARVVLTEPDPHLRKRLAKGMLAAHAFVEVSSAPAESLGFADESFDVVVSTLVLCSVRDPVRAIAEAQRVLRPGGRLLFIEHVLGEGKRAQWQKRMRPLWSRMLGGCQITRDTVGEIERSGLRIDELRTLEPEKALALMKPVMVGTAVRL